MTTVSEWSVGLVEDLLFRQFMKGEDISSLIPPTPECNPEAYLSLYESTAKILHSYVRNGPQPAPLTSQQPNVVASAKSIASRGPATPVKGAPAASSVSALSAAATATVNSGPSNFSAAVVKTPKGGAADGTKVPPAAGGGANQSARTPKDAAPAGIPTLRDAVPPPAPVMATAASASVPASPSAGGGGAGVVVKRERPATAAVGGGVAPVDPLSPKGKKVRVEWPIDIPNNAVLKSKSRSAVAHLTTCRVRAQQLFDPDLIFQQPRGELPLHVIFGDYPKALKAIAAIRGSSGDWHDDTFTLEEESQYKRDVGITVFGPSQCMFGQPITGSQL